MSHLHLLPRPPMVEAHPEDACLSSFQLELDYILATLRRLGVPPSELEDMAHEVFLVLRRKWAEYDPARPLRPYLFGIVFRLAAAQHRKRIREAKHLALAIDGAEVVHPELALQSKQAGALVLAALEKIPLPRRAVLVMHDMDDVPMQDVAVTLSVPLFTAYSRLRKARKELALLIRRIVDRERSV
jgi:RNA polymerase sigma-70 factor (ECF subfamily)